MQLIVTAKKIGFTTTTLCEANYEDLLDILRSKWPN